MRAVGCPPSRPAGRPRRLRADRPARVVATRTPRRRGTSRDRLAAPRAGAGTRRRRAVRPRVGRGSSRVEPSAMRRARAPGRSATATGRREEREPAGEPRTEEAAPFSGQKRDDGEQEVERLAVDGLEEERHREEGEVEHRAACAVGSELSFGEVVEQDERREAGRERDDDPGEQVVAEKDVSEQADGRRVEREEGRGRAGEVLVAVLGDAEEPDAVPARPDVRDGAQVVRHRGVVPARRVGVSARFEDEEGEERRNPDRQAAPDEDLDSRIARADSSGQVARLGAWLPKPLTRAHNGRIIRAWRSGTSRLRRRTRRSERCVR